MTTVTVTSVRAAVAANPSNVRFALQQCLARAEAHKHLNYFTSLTPQAPEPASKPRPLEGVPIAVKDNFCTKGLQTSAGSKMLENFIAPYDATVVQRLRDAGAIIIGKTNMDEFGMGSANQQSNFGPALHPRDSNRVPGGSSGGSAGAVAMGMCAAALGTDTGGSVRLPAAFCGVVGLKPTYGRLSRYGVVAYASSLDTPGILSHTVRDAAILLDVMAGHDPHDATSLQDPLPVCGWEKALEKSGDLKGFTIGIPKEFHVAELEMTAPWRAGIEWLREAGAKIVSVDVPQVKNSLAAYYVIAAAEAASCLARYDGVRYGHHVPGASFRESVTASRSAGFGDEVKRRVLLGHVVLSRKSYESHYRRATAVRTLLKAEFAKAFEGVNALLTPTALGPALRRDVPSDPVTVYVNDVMTVPASLAGLPAISVPTATSAEGLSLGLQVIGAAGDETAVLRVAEALERRASQRASP